MCGLVGKHRFRRQCLRILCPLVVLAYFSLPTQGQFLAANDDDNGKIVPSSSSTVPLDPAILSTVTPFESYLPDGSLPVEGTSGTLSHSGLPLAVTPVSNRPVPPTPPTSFNLKAAFWQSFGENAFYHAWRVASDPGLRWNLEHKPFFHDWFASYKGYDMHRWGDGDDFIVNDVGHPLEGAVFSRTFLQNSPRSQVAIGKNSRYWTSRLKAMAWAAAWSVQLEIGPISETSIGNQGGFTYVPKCGIYTSCLNNPKFHKPPTNNTGWTDFVVTPLIGTAWVLGEDTIDKYIAAPVAVNHRILGGRILRSALEPSRSFAAIFAGKFPWDLPSPESGFVAGRSSHFPSSFGDFELPPLGHYEFGAQYSNISLPVVSQDCYPAAVCRKNLYGLGFNVGYNFTRAVAFDSSLNLMPGQQGTTSMIEGLFGFRVGPRFERFGVFAKLRPGFIYYENAQPRQGDDSQGSLTRFATDLGAIFEYYPKHNSTLRFDVGTTLVRYLTNHPAPIYPLGSLLSPQYIVTQGNFQMSTSYTLHF